MSMPFNPSPNGAPAPGQASFPMPPGQATFQAQTPAQPAQVIREQGWQGYPASQLPPVQQPPQAPAPGLMPGQFQQVPPAQYQPGMQVPTQHAQPQTQPGQQFQQPNGQPQQVPPGIDPNTVLQGPAFPRELQGVTLGQAIQMYGGMRELILGLQQRQMQTAAQPQTQQQQQPQAPQPGQQTPAFDWRNPGPSLAAVLGPMIDEKLNQALAPVTGQAFQNAAAQARQAIATEIGPQRFAQLEPAVLRYLQGAGPQDLANPELWRIAVRTAAGEMALAGQLPQAQQQQQTLGGQYGGAVPFQPGMRNPAPPLQSFFTESPQAGGPPVQGVTLSPQQMWFADQMGVSYADYASYSQGVPAVLPNGGRR